MSELANEEGLVIVLTTESNIKNARNLANIILKEKYAGCVSFNMIKSMFWWEGKVEDSEEIQLIIKTEIKIIKKLFKLIKNIHSYDNPELIYWRVKSSSSYNNWLIKSLVIKDIQ